MFCKIRSAFPFAAAVLLFASCAGNPGYYQSIDAEIQAGSYSAALLEIESKKVKKDLYPSKNSILYYLDRGMIEHYAGLWRDSSESLQTGEWLIEEAFTKSLGQEISAYITNDNSRDYSGEDYEDLYINVFNALNYYHREDLEGALVEIRRLNEKLLYLSSKYEIAREKVMSSSSSLRGTREYTVEAVKFSNSALARYLGVLFYRTVGNADSARIDMEKLIEAYQLAPSVYYNPLPRSLEDEIDIPQGKARLNVIGFTGLSPVKEEVFLDIPLPFPPPNNWTRLALPQMSDRPSAIISIEVVLESAGMPLRFELELLEDMGNVARETFRSRYGLILLKTVARTIIKGGLSAGIAGAAANRDEGLGLLIGFIGKIASVATERADVRIARYFPAYAHIGGINLDPGIYSVRVNYYSRRGLISTEVQDNVQVLEGRLNLREFICLK